MRRIIWAIFLCAAYIWVITSKHDDQLLRVALHFYEKTCDWLKDAEIAGIPQKKSRKW